MTGVSNSKPTLTDRFMRAALKRETLAKLCVAVFLGMILPLVIIALYNYPADDDFFYSLEAARAFAGGAPLTQVFAKLPQRVAELYQSWQGNFTHAFIVACSPIIFNINLYFLANWFALAMLCFSLYALAKTFIVRLLGADKYTLWIAYTALMILILQFLPSASEGLFWHSGAAYTIAFTLELFVINGLVRSERSMSAARRAISIVLITLGAFLVGGCHFAVSIGALVAVTLLALRSFIARGKGRLTCLLAWLGLAAAVVISLIAPGNAVRQSSTGETMGIVYTLVHSVGESLDFLGKTLTPQLLAAAMLILPALYKPLKESRFEFRLPLLVLVGLYGVYASTFAPGIYATNSLVALRYENIVYFNAVLAILGGLVYAEGWLIRRLNRSEESAEALQKLEQASALGGKRFTALYLAICIAFLALGGFASTIMNTTSISAVKSIATGEAARFRLEMEERAEYVRVTDSDVVQVAPLGNKPHVFKSDRLPFLGIYGRVRYMKWYYEAFYEAEHGKAPQQE